MSELTNWPQAFTIVGVVFCIAMIFIVLAWRSN